MKIQIREASLADVPVVAQLFDLYRQFYQQAPDIALARQFVADRLARSESVVLLAEAEEASEIVGFCLLYPTFCSVEAAAVYTLSDLFVLPTARKHGAGRLLLLAAEARAMLDGRTRLDLTTARTNRTAQSLYESLGWVRDEVFLAYNRWPTSPA